MIQAVSTSIVHESRNEIWVRLGLILSLFGETRFNAMQIQCKFVGANPFQFPTWKQNRREQQTDLLLRKGKEALQRALQRQASFIPTGGV